MTSMKGSSTCCTAFHMQAFSSMEDVPDTHWRGQHVGSGACCWLWLPGTEEALQAPHSACQRLQSYHASKVHVCVGAVAWHSIPCAVECCMTWLHTLLLWRTQCSEWHSRHASRVAALLPCWSGAAKGLQKLPYLEGILGLLQDPFRPKASRLAPLSLLQRLHEQIDL